MSIHHPLNILLTPLVGFAFFTLVGWLLYRLGGAMAPKLNPGGAKLTQYACGEEFPARKLQVGYKLFFYAALFFTIMHVAALVAATIPGGNMAFAMLGVLYLLMILLSIFALILK
jgi:hypothetical protein